MANVFLRSIGFGVIILGGLFGIITQNTISVGIVVAVGTLIAAMGDAL